jgi:NADH-quinone oxidoreductase subunit A
VRDFPVASRGRDFPGPVLEGLSSALLVRFGWHLHVSVCFLEDLALETGTCQRVRPSGLTSRAKVFPQPAVPCRFNRWKRPAGRVWIEKGSFSEFGRNRMEIWFPIVVTLVLAGVIVGVMVTINSILGPKRPSPIKGEAFECGNPPSGSAWGRFSVRFYLTALLFLVFDVEVIFLYPWAVELRELGMLGFVEVLVFIAILFVGLIYAWERGALDWD